MLRLLVRLGGGRRTAAAAAVRTLADAPAPSAQQQSPPPPPPPSAGHTAGSDGAGTTHFGYKTVAREEKESMVGAVFHRVADRYDLMNDLMSGFTHRIWKDLMVRDLRPMAGHSYLDVAGGTGDIAFRIIRALQAIPMEARARKPASRVTVCDINPSMLKVGQQRARVQGLEKPGVNISVDWVEGNAEQLPFSDNTYDAYTIAFGIRNCTNVDKVVAEAFRVLKPGGRFLCLEFSQVPNPLLRQIYDLYSFNVIPTLGQIVAQDRDSYQYLVESIRQFPDQETFADMIRAAGFAHVTYTNMTFGVVALHSGFKLLPPA